MEGLLLVLLFVNTQDAEISGHRKQAALQKAFEASYQHSSAQEAVNTVNKRYVPKPLQILGADVFAVQHALQEHQIVLRWEFQ